MKAVLKTVSINRLWHFINYTFWEDLNVVSITIVWEPLYS